MSKSVFMQLMEQNLNEIKFEDQFGKGFMEFYNKYTKRPYNSQTGLYVNFSNFGDNTIDKNPSPTTGHGDPTAIYGYPIDYIKKFPNDVRYGMSATYLRVIRRRDVKTLSLQHMNDSDMSQMFKNEFGEWWDSWESPLKKFYNMTNSKAVWFRAMQLKKGELDKIEQYFKDYRRDRYTTKKPDLEIKSGQEQTDMFVRFGYKILEDTAKSQSKAIVNDREPEQILFLTRDSFELVESFMIRGEGNKDKAKDRSIVSLDSKHEEAMKRRIAAGIARGIGDNLMSETGYTSNQMGNAVYFTNKGRTIGIYFAMPENYMDNKKWGEKPHREFKKSNHLMVRVYIVSEKALIKTSSWSDESFEDIIAGVVERWKNEEKENPDFVPVRSSKELEELAKKRRAIEHDNKMTTSINQFINNEPSGFDVMSQKTIADHYHVFYPEKPSKSEVFLYEYMIYLALAWSKRYAGDSDESKAEQERVLKLDKVPAYIIAAGEVSDESIHGALELRGNILKQLWEEKYDGVVGFQSWKGDVRDYYATSTFLKYLQNKAK